MKKAPSFLLLFLLLGFFLILSLHSSLKLLLLRKLAQQAYIQKGKNIIYFVVVLSQNDNDDSKSRSLSSPCFYGLSLFSVFLSLSNLQSLERYSPTSLYFFHSPNPYYCVVVGCCCCSCCCFASSIYQCILQLSYLSIYIYLILNSVTHEQETLLKLCI